jgi:hypothetical protein
LGGAEIVVAFHSIDGTWLMELDDGWYAYCNDEPRIGPFPSMIKAAEAGLEKWGPK